MSPNTHPKPATDEAVLIGHSYQRPDQSGWTHLQITLRSGASDEEIARAIDTWQRAHDVTLAALITTANAAAMQAGEHLPAAMRQERDEPASQKQRVYLDSIREDLQWSADELAHVATERGLDLATMTKRQASELIDTMKAILAGSYPSSGARAGRREPAAASDP